MHLGIQYGLDIAPIVLQEGQPILSVFFDVGFGGRIGGAYPCDINE